MTTAARRLRRQEPEGKARLPVWTPDHLWIKVVDGKMDARALVIALLRARLAWFRREGPALDVAAAMVGLSDRSFAETFRALLASGHVRGMIEHGRLIVLWVGMETRRVRQDTWQLLGSEQLRGMAGATLRSRLAAAIVDLRRAGLPGGWSLRGAAAAIHVDRRTVRAARKRKEENDPLHGTEGEYSDSLPVGPGGTCRGLLQDHERSRNPEPDRNLAEPEPSLVPVWKLDALFRGLSLAKNGRTPHERKPRTECLADLLTLPRAPEWTSDDPRHRRIAAGMLLDAGGVHVCRDATLDRGRNIWRRQIELRNVLADSGAPLEELRQVALRLARNPNVVSVGAVLARSEIGAWLARHVTRWPMEPSRKESFSEMRERTRVAREKALAEEREREDAIMAQREKANPKRKRAPVDEDIEALEARLRCDVDRIDRAWAMLADYRAGKSMFDIEATFKVEAEVAHRLIQGALRASRPPIVVGE